MNLYSAGCGDVNMAYTEWNISSSLSVSVLFIYSTSVLSTYYIAGAIVGIGIL